jgi:LCP family protein required for cell wall assembly
MELGGKVAMSDTSVQDFFARQAEEARGPEPSRPPRQKRRRRLRRIAIAVAASLVVVAGGLVGTAYLYVQHEVGSVHRIQVAALTAAHQPVARGGLNVLLTSSGPFPGLNGPTGLIELLHLDASHRDGAVISFPANVVVHVPGHGEEPLGSTLTLGGPSLMIETIEDLTGVRIEHYSRITYSGLSSVVGAMGGVEVLVPYPTTSLGFHFHAGINRITSANALAYVRQPAVSQVGRTELQENLFRAILHKIASERFFVGTDFHVLNAVVSAVSVDSSFTNSQLVSLAEGLGRLQGSDGVSIDVPTTGSPRSGGIAPVFLIRHLANQLWRAIRTDTVMQFAHRYPETVTPIAPG